MTFGRACTIAMPAIVQELQSHNINPVFSFGFLGIVAVVLLRFMPESKDNITEFIEEEIEAEDVKPDAPLIPLERKESIQNPQ